MTTNQTIDGVPRADLESICEHFEFGRHWQAMEGVKKLRALLGAPVCSNCAGLERNVPCPDCKPAAHPQGEPIHQWSDDDGVSWCDGNERSLQSAREAGWKTRTLYAQQPPPDNALKAFANDMIAAAFEGGSFDGGDIQDIAVKHGLLRIERREEECGEVCACRSEGDGFPADCYRKTALLCGEQPAPVAVALSNK